MTKVVSSYGPTQRVNILKKIKVDSAWNFYPAVVESNGKLKDKVRIKGAVEVHPEGTYYLEWREGKSRSREPVPDKADVLDWARRKFLELQAAKAGVLIAETPEQVSPGITLADAAADYLEDIKPPQREKKTYSSPGRSELWDVHQPPRKPLFRWTVLLEVLPAQVQAHFRYA
jgi:hypothetical protein